jgi:hypothetical protein
MKTFLTTLAVAAAISFPALAEGEIHGNAAGEPNASVSAATAPEPFVQVPLNTRVSAMVNSRLNARIEGGSDVSTTGSASAGGSGGADVGVGATGAGGSAGGIAGTE